MKHVLALTISCLALSACGGDDNGDSGGSQVKRAIEPEAEQHAESILLTLSDFPDGWRAEATAAEDEDDQEAFNECVGADYSGLTIIGEAHSDDFLMGDTAVASSDVAVFESEQMATQAYAEWADALEADEADTCLPKLLGEPPGDVEITSVEVDELSFTPPAGVDDADAWQVAVTIEGKAGSQDEGLSVTVYSDLVVLRNGDTNPSVTTTDIATQFDPEVRDQLVAAVATRMAE
jgi:hypothetical protein